MKEQTFSFNLSDELRALIITDTPNDIPGSLTYTDKQYQSSVIAAIGTFKNQCAIMYPSEGNFLTGLFGANNISKNIIVPLAPGQIAQSYPSLLTKTAVGVANSLGTKIPPNAIKFTYMVMTYTQQIVEGLGQPIESNTTNYIVFIYTT